MYVKTASKLLLSVCLLALTSATSAVAWRLPEWAAQILLSLRVRSYRPYLVDGSSCPLQTLPDYYRTATTLNILRSYPRLRWHDPLAELAAAQLPIPPSITLGHPVLSSAAASLFVFGLAAAVGWITCVHFLSPDYSANIRRRSKTGIIAANALLSATARLLLLSGAVAAALSGLHAVISTIVGRPFCEHHSEGWILIGLLLGSAALMIRALRRFYRREIERHVPPIERRCLTCDYDLFASRAPVCPECGAVPVDSLYQPTPRSDTTGRGVIAAALVATLASLCLQSLSFHRWASDVRVRREFPNADFSATYSRLIRVAEDRPLLVETDAVPPLWVIQFRSATDASADAPHREPTLLCVAATTEVAAYLKQLSQPETVNVPRAALDAVVTGGALSNGIAHGWLGSHKFTAVIEAGWRADSQAVTIKIEAPLRVLSVERCGSSQEFETLCGLLDRVDTSQLPAAETTPELLGPPTRLRDLYDPDSVTR
ncbi:MAG: hypothetical protein ACK4WH_14310 [Phycisphaerales bacterium]